MANSRTIKKMINEKMRLLDDFRVCEYSDDAMRKRLEEAIKERPNVDPQIVLDSYCKPLVQEVMNSWH